MSEQEPKKTDEQWQKELEEAEENAEVTEEEEGEIIPPEKEKETENKEEDISLVDEESTEEEEEPAEEPDTSVPGPNELQPIDLLCSDTEFDRTKNLRRLEGVTQENVQEKIEEDYRVANALRRYYATEDELRERNNLAAGVVQRTYENSKKNKEEGQPVLVPDTDDRKASRTAGGSTGRKAEVSMLAALHGVKKIYLYNSGFSILLRPPMIGDLSLFVSSVDMETEELGSVLGGLAYAVSDVHIKRKFSELMKKWVEDSNLVGWDEGDTLIDNLSYHDLETVVWGICTLMYRDCGIPIKLACIDDSCDWYVEETTADLDKMRQRRLDVLTQEQLEFCWARKMRTPEELVEYRNGILALHKTVPGGDVEGRVDYHFSVPTLSSWLDESESLVNEMVSRINQQRGDQDERALVELITQYEHQFRPWVERVVVWDEPNDERPTSEAPLTDTMDRGGIKYALEMDIIDRDRMFEEFDNFFGESKISFFGHTAVHCPKCGASPVNATEDEFTPVDIMTVLFNLACRKLGVV